MRNTKFCNIRFNLDNPAHRKAWEHLQTMDRDKYKSYSNTVINAINSYFESEYNSNLRETEWEKQLDKRIISAIRKGFAEVISTNITERIFNDNKSELQTDDIDWEFLGDIEK
ncbi:hypothetical protein FMM68_00145 [Lachnospiraceae bacterium MD329]|jgi:hypothetical protein|nr:hypothetical protein [Lachnospiraceae bacterium MD329]